MKLIQVNRGVAEGGRKGAGNSRGGQICGRLDYLIAKKTIILGKNVLHSQCLCIGRCMNVYEETRSYLFPFFVKRLSRFSF